ncbi:MAG TPA: DUF87 domain-containing protein [Thermoplasmata archaeon]|nr:DUF87 domain-containing protein [Thermoplasmata archaeon]
MTAPPEPDAVVEGATFVRSGRRYRAPLLVRQFPGEVPFGFLGRLLPTTEPLEMVVEAHRIPSHDALLLLHGARAVAETELSRGGGLAETPALEAERASAEELGRAVARRTQELWKVGVRWAAVGSTRPRVERVRARLAERLATLGFRSRIPRYQVAEALAPPRLTGVESRPAGYWQTLPTDGVAALFPFVDETIAEPGGVLVGLGLSDASPVFLDRWAHASFSWGLFGTTGSGKSFAAALLFLRTRWMRPGVEVVILDPLGEFAPLVRALGGSVVRLAGGQDGRLNPLDPGTTGGDRAEKAARVGAMLRALFPSLRDEEVAALDAAVTRLYDGGGPPPTFDGLCAACAGASGATERLRSFLEVFRSGSLRSLNGPTSMAPATGLVDFDFRGVPAEQLAFHLAYVLDWSYGRLRDRPGPKLLIVDEAHRFAGTPSMAEFLDRVVRHVRHFEAGVVLLSQNPDDFLGLPSGRSLLRNLYAVGLFRLPEVSGEARAFFGLTAAEAEWLPRARLPREAGYSESLWRVGEMHLPLAVVASTPEYELLTGTLGRDPPPDAPGPAAARAGGL